MLTTPRGPQRLAVLTSGGDAAGMNPAVRAVVRTALDERLDAVDEHTGLAAAGAGEDHQWPLPVSDRAALLRVQHDFTSAQTHHLCL